MGRQRKLTEFGKVIWGIAGDREIYFWAELHRQLQAHGWPYSRQHLVDRFSGKAECDEEFVRLLDEVLRFDRREKEEVAYAWAYKQARHDDPNPKTAVHKMAHTLGWTESQKREIAYRHIFAVGAYVMSA